MASCLCVLLGSGSHMGEVFSYVSIKELPRSGELCLRSPGRLTGMETDRRIFPYILRMLPAHGTFVEKHPHTEECP